MDLSSSLSTHEPGGEGTPRAGGLAPAACRASHLGWWPPGLLFYRPLLEPSLPGRESGCSEAVGEEGATELSRGSSLSGGSQRGSVQQKRRLHPEGHRGTLITPIPSSLLWSKFKVPGFLATWAQVPRQAACPSGWAYPHRAAMRKRSIPPSDLTEAL